MATKRPVTSMVDSSPVFRFRRFRVLSFSSPCSPVTSVSQTKRIFSWARARSAMVLEARSSSRRWMTVTVEANLVRNSASSMAESPPPTTAMF